MGSNGIVKEKAHLNVDKQKYEEGWERIFGNKKACKECSAETMDLCICEKEDDD